jgi:predicted ATPase with chaperone activity
MSSFLASKLLSKTQGAGEGSEERVPSPHAVEEEEAQITASSGEDGLEAGQETPMGPSEAPGRGLDLAVPPIPRSLGETGLSRDLLVGLLLKTVQQRGTLSGFGISDALGLPFSLVDDLLMDLQKSGMLEVKETDGPARSSYSFALTGKGRERAGEEAQASRYVGPAPVPFQQYVDWVLRQSVETVRIRRELLEEGLSDLVLPDGFLDLLGPAVNSGKSLFLYGDPGNGKTRIAEAVAELFGEAFFVPHAVDLDGHIMVLYDPVFHEALEPLEDSSWEHPPGPTLFRDLPRHDRRFVKVKRPVAMAGAELELSQLDLRYDPFGRTYQAPIQLKANGGVLVIDDLGRQRVRPRDLLNRWIVPLEHRVDYLSLESGKKIAVPFDCLVVFSTNIEPWELVEEAFLRRIHYKIRVSDPDPRQFDEIFSRCCEEEGIPFDPAAPEMVRREFYEPGKAIPRGCHPRDILSHLRDIALFRGMEPDLSPGLLRQACESYFVAMAPGEMPAKDPPEKGLTP